MPASESEPSDILTINGGSSSIKCAIFRAGDLPQFVLRETVDGGTAESLVDWIEDQPSFANVGAVGHRIVHGMQHIEPELITGELLRDLRAMVTFVPEHLPREIELIELMRERHPALRHVACFD